MYVQPIRNETLEDHWKYPVSKELEERYSESTAMLLQNAASSNQGWTTIKVSDHNYAHGRSAACENCDITPMVWMYLFIYCT